LTFVAIITLDYQEDGMTVQHIKGVIQRRYLVHMTNNHNHREALELLALYDTLFGSDLTADARQTELQEQHIALQHQG
jgi:hypothetical protein